MSNDEILASFPPGFLAAVAAVLVEGARVKGCEPWESGGGQTLADHLRHAEAHVYGAIVGDTTEPHLEHAAARCALAWATRVK